MADGAERDGRPLVLVTAPFDAATAGRLAGKAELLTRVPCTDSVPLADGPHAAHLAEAAALVCELDVVDRRSLDACPRLELVVACRSDPVTVDIAACAARGIEVRTTPGRNADAAADLTMALLLDTVRRVGEAQRWLRSGSWDPADRYAPYHALRGPVLRGLTLGVVGAGAVGLRVAERAKGFGMRVVVATPRRSQADLPGLTLLPLDELLRTCDVVSLHAPLSRQTRGMIGARELGLMPRHAFLINTARAALVDEPALLAAVADGRIAGVGLDVFWQEPPPKDHPLFHLPGVTMTPHIGGASDDVVVQQTAMAVGHLEAWLQRRATA